MTSRKIHLALLSLVMVVQLACSARKVEDGDTYETGPDGVSETSTAADRAETTVANIDTAAIIIPADTITDSVSRKRKM